LLSSVKSFVLSTTKQDPFSHQRISFTVSLGSDTPSVELSIAAVERDTGLGKDTLRVWERRYGFPVPRRDANDERSYPMAQVEKLRAIKRLMDHGHRPGRVVGMTLQELQHMSDALMGTPTPIGMGHAARKAEVAHYVTLLRSHDTEGLRQQLKQALANQGLKQFVTHVVAPLTAAVGDAWLAAGPFHRQPPALR
jgi:DNA-binding transcriptional MerR regulator